MTFVIGDIHGELNKLEKLINSLQNFKDLELIFIGDYIDKGDCSKETLEFLRQLSKSNKCTFLLGNHEYAWLELVQNGTFVNFLQKHGGIATAKSFGMQVIEQKKAKDTLYEPYSDFFDNLHVYVEQDDYIISHSGLKLDSYDMDLRYIQKESFLFARHDFLANEDRYRGKQFIIGHTGFYYPFVDNAKICIDTGAVYYKKAPLTAFCIDEGFFVDSSAKLYKQSDLPKNCCPNIIKERLTHHG